MDLSIRTINFTVNPNHKGDTITKKIEKVLRDSRIRTISTIIVDNA
jgi:hypothetical protein